jgi:transcriptional regulator GlxA family with amidase domain
MAQQLSEVSRASPAPWAALTAGTSGLLERLLHAATAADASNRAKARNTLESALALLVTTSDSNQGRAQGLVRGGLAPWQAKRVAAYIREHLGMRLKASELAKLVDLSYSHFNRAFKVSFRETPTAYIMGQRMRLARDRMLTTDLSLSQVALECGLCDQAHFSRMFRRIVGLSPLMWRRQFAAEFKSEA